MSKRKKETRGDWVAVESDVPLHHSDEIRRNKSAFGFFQKEKMTIIRNQLMAANGASDLGDVQKELSRSWKEAESAQSEEYLHYVKLALDDKKRFQEESARRDAEIEAERAKKRAKRDEIPVDKKKRDRKVILTGEQQEELERKESLALLKANRQPKVLTEEEKKAKKRRDDAKAKETNEKLALKQEEARQKDELSKRKAETANARLKYLLAQSDIFAHFGLDPAAAENEGKKKKKKKKVQGTSTTTAKRLSEHDEDEEDVDKEVEVVRLTKQPSCIKFGTLRGYQLEGLNWLINLGLKGINGILADEMGLGKTLQTISVLAYYHEFKNISGPHIVLVPKSTLSNWLSEFKRWCPALRAIKFHGTKEERHELINTVLCPGLSEDERRFDVCVTTFEMCLREKSAITKFAWNYLVIDEAHRIKNESSQFSQVVRSLDCEHRLLLTGTPLQNNLHELWALLNFLLPDVFSSSEQFDEWFNLDVDDDEAKKQVINQLHRILRPFMIRRLKSDVEKALPPKKETLLYVGMSEMQKQLYKSLLLRDMDAVTGNSSSRTALLNIVMQLRKCCGHPYLFEGQEDRTLDPLGEHLITNCGKMVLLDKLLVKLKARGSRVLIFSQMTRVLDILEDFCRMRQYGYCRIDGQTSYDDRESSIDEYNRPGSEKYVFLLSTRAGGLGINLYTADIVILYDSDWNPQADLQAQDRAHRIGQKKEVNVYRLTTSNSVEEKIIERAQQKLKLDAMVVQQGRLQEGQKKLSKNDMLSMIRFGADQVFRAESSNAITDEDIDAILAQGEERTRQLTEKLQAHDKGDLLDFKLDGGGNCQDYNGVDYSSEKKRQDELKRLADAEIALALSEGLGKRERKNLVDMPDNGLEATDRQLNKKLLPKNLRLPKMEEWQFYPRQRLHQISEIEYTNYMAWKEANKKNPDPSSQENNEEIAKTNNEYDGAAGRFLSESLQEEKERLIKNAFGDWSRQHYNLFIKLLARHGRENLSLVANDMGRPVEAVTNYAAVFWDKGPQELKDFSKTVAIIEKGESKLLEIQRLTEETRKKISKYKNPWEQLKLNYQGKQGKLYTEEEDRYLLCLVDQFGYGNWDQIKREIRHSKQFLFDYYLRSRTTLEIGRRCDMLMRVCERDNADVLQKEQKEQKARDLLNAQRKAMQERLQQAKENLIGHQKKVDQLILKEAQKMQKQRSNRQKKSQMKPKLIAFLQRKETSSDLAQVALDFSEEIMLEAVTAKQIMQMIPTIAKLKDPPVEGESVWQILEKKKTKKSTNIENVNDTNQQDTSPKKKKKELPKSPWSPSAFKQSTKSKSTTKKPSSTKKGRKHPKPGRSPYVLYGLSKRRESKTPSSNVIEMMGKIAESWKKLTPAEKEPWEMAAKDDLKRYEREVEEMNALTAKEVDDKSNTSMDIDN